MSKDTSKQVTQFPVIFTDDVETMEIKANYDWLAEFDVKQTLMIVLYSIAKAGAEYEDTLVKNKISAEIEESQNVH